MPPRRQPICLVCHCSASKYVCTVCRVEYCSVACYKRHQETCSTGSAGNDANADDTRLDEGGPSTQASPDAESSHPQPLQDPTPLRPLTTLKWPYIPDTSAYPNPLTRDDPKALQLHQYEAIATSPVIRTFLTSHPRLLDRLIAINALRGTEREQALERALGVDSRLLKNGSDANANGLDEDTRAFRAFAEAVESAVRGGREDVLGLDWD